MIDMVKNNTETDQPQPLIQRFHVIRANSQHWSRFRHELSTIEQQLQQQEQTRDTARVEEKKERRKGREGKKEDVWSRARGP